MSNLVMSLDKGAMLPIKAHADDAGFDLHSPLNVEVPVGSYAMVNTGVHVQLPKNTVGFVKNRSSMFKAGLTCDGTIDCGYTGPIMVCIFNRGKAPYMIRRGDRIAQLVVCRLEPLQDIEVVETLEDTDRGAGGFGSSGK